MMMTVMTMMMTMTLPTAMMMMRLKMMMTIKMMITMKMMMVMMMLLWLPWVSYRFHDFQYPFDSLWDFGAPIFHVTESLRQGRLVKTCLLEAHNRRQLQRWWRVWEPVGRWVSAAFGNGNWWKWCSTVASTSVHIEHIYASSRNTCRFKRTNRRIHSTIMINYSPTA